MTVVVEEGKDCQVAKGKEGEGRRTTCALLLLSLAEGDGTERSRGGTHPVINCDLTIRFFFFFRLHNSEGSISFVFLYMSLFFVGYECHFRYRNGRKLLIPLWMKRRPKQSVAFGGENVLNDDSIFYSTTDDGFYRS